MRSRPILVAGLILASACTTTAGRPTVSNETPSQTPSPLPGGAPRRIVAITEDESLVELDARDGRVLRTILRARADVNLDALSLSPDGETAYLERARGGREPHVVSVSVSGGRPAPLTVGSTPRLSPDGTRIAVVRRADGDEYDPSLIAVHELASGEERTWRRPGGPNIGGMYFAGWLPDSRRFLFGECGADPPCGISGIVDVTEPGGPLRRSSVGPGHDGSTIWGAWEFAVPRTEGSLAVAAKQGTGGPSPTRIEDVDPGDLGRTGSILRTSRDAFHLDFDRSGRHLLFVGRPSRHDGPSALFRWHGGEPVRLSEDVDEAAW